MSEYTDYIYEMMLENDETWFLALQGFAIRVPDASLMDC